MSKQRKYERLPRIASLVIVGSRDERRILCMAASLMLAAHDPMGSVVLEAADIADRQISRNSHVQAIAGGGVAGTVDGQAVVVGGASFLVARGLSLGDFESWDVRRARKGQRIIFVAVEEELAAFIAFDNAAFPFQLSGNRKESQ